MSRFTRICFLTLLNSIPLVAQLQEAGTSDYALANSSVVWLPKSSSLFLNPGELARLHQNDFIVSTSWFHSLASMSGDLFVPFLGTFGLGTMPVGNSTLYSAGFGRLVNDYSTIGGAMSVLTDVRGGFRFSLGGALHLPLSAEESGWHAGVSATNLPVRGIVNAGIGYWIIPATLRVQFATQTRLARAAFLGGEVKASENVHLQFGVRSFQYVSAGISYATPYAVAELGAGSQGLSFTLNVRFGDGASENHQKALDQANEAYVDQRYSEAQRLFATAVQFEEYDDEARVMTERTKQIMDSSVAVLVRQAEAAEHEDDYPAAMKAYAEIFKMNPSEANIATQSANIGTKFRSHIGQLLASGDSLLGRREVTRARRYYDQVLEFDPENDTASARIDQLDNLSKENVRATLGRARSFLNKNRLDDAQREYEKALLNEPNNSQAKAGLNAIRNRRVHEQLEEAKTAFNEKKYFDALTLLTDILQKDAGNKEARTYLEKARDALKEDLDRLFKRGLQFYIKEDYKSAISEWDKVLMIQPSDSSTLEYRKRAEEKLKALEQFK